MILTRYRTLLDAFEKRYGNEALSGQIIEAEATRSRLEKQSVKQRGSLDPDEVAQFLDNGELAERKSQIRLIRTIRIMTPDEISDPALIGLTQLTVELGEVNFPINQKSTEKEPQTWLNAIRSQGIGGALLQGFSRWWSEKLDQTRAMKKASACLFYISDKPMVDIEAAMTQFGGGTNGAAGPVRSVASRTADLLETVVRTVEILHPAIELNDRPGRLLIRLQNGVSAKAADIASLFGSTLSRGDYQALVRHNLHCVQALNDASEKQIAQALGSSSGVKIAQMRRLLADNAHVGASAFHILPVYES